ncbi:MAG: CBS domain-containing protein [Candidatus Helarchaeota archaeon]|nr:CBS domain-containing protein [Candidatus Helarchaeota archaeon]
MINLPTPEDLKRYRKNCGLTQKELAEKASVSQALIARIETGTVDPSLSTLRRILEVLNETHQKELKAINVAVIEVITIQASDPLSKASKLMFDNGISQLPVCDANGHVIGAIKEKTISMKLIAKGTDILSKPITEIMVKEDALPMLPSSTSLRSVEDLLTQHGHSAVLLMDGGKIVGILTKADVIKTYLR